MKIARCNPSTMPLTPRQTEVLKLIASGLTSRQAAAELGISVKTVETHRADLMRRLDVHKVVELVHYAVEHEIIAVLHVGFDALSEEKATEFAEAIA